MVTDVGPVAAVAFELVNVTFNPPVGAIPLRVTVPVTTVFPLPWNVVGVTEIEARLAG
jgi:hypothetical protein